jgi:hypothetical protein
MAGQMVGLVLVIAAVIFMARINPYLTSILISGIVGFLFMKLFIRLGNAPLWLVPIGIIFWIAVASPPIADLLKSVVPPRRKREER